MAQYSPRRSKTKNNLEKTEGLFQIEGVLKRVRRQERTIDQSDRDFLEAWKRESNFFEILECDLKSRKQANLHPQPLRFRNGAWRAVEYLLNVSCLTQAI